MHTNGKHVGSHCIIKNSTRQGYGFSLRLDVGVVGVSVGLVLFFSRLYSIALVTAETDFAAMEAGKLFELSAACFQCTPSASK